MKINCVVFVFQCTKMLGKLSPHSLDLHLSTMRKEEYSERLKKLFVCLNIFYTIEKNINGQKTIYYFCVNRCKSFSFLYRQRHKLKLFPAVFK